MNRFRDIVSMDRPAPGTLSLFWLEQSHFILKTHAGALIHVDPFLSRDVKPENHIHPEPLAEPDELAADAVFVTHDHRDHADPHTLVPMLEANPSLRVYGPPEVGVRFAGYAAAGRVVTIRPGDSAEAAGAAVRALYAEPTGGEGDVTHIGLLFEIDGVSIYFTGDTRDEPDDYLGKIDGIFGMAPDALVVPINEGYRNPGPRGAARFVEVTDPGVVIPCHFGCFVHNTIDPARFVEAVKPEYRGRIRIMDRGGKVAVASVTRGR